MRYTLLEDGIRDRYLTQVRRLCRHDSYLDKTADDTLKNGKNFPVVAVIDEACQLNEVGILLVWAHSTETLLLLVFLGETK